MKKNIYSRYKDRLVEIGGSSKCLYLKKLTKKASYDLGRILEGRDGKIAEFTDFLSSGSKFPFSLLNSREKKEILPVLEASAKKSEKKKDGDESDADLAGTRPKKDTSSRLWDEEITSLRLLRREIEDIEKETGRYELFIGYPFVFGSVSAAGTQTLVKAPLLLFPVRIDIPDDTTVELRLDAREKIRINPALVLTYAQSRKISVEGLNLEYDTPSELGSVKNIIALLAKHHIKIELSAQKNVLAYPRFKEPSPKDELSVRYAAVLGRFSLSNSIYEDYCVLEKKKWSNEAIDELLRSKKIAKPQQKTQFPCHNVRMLDYAQETVVKKVGQGGNMVIYGPPGTGKSETIVNIIADAICKKKKVLVVSQKKAALDVVYNRLGFLAQKAMYIVDEDKEKQSFYERCLSAHQNAMIASLTDIKALENDYNDIEGKIQEEAGNLTAIHETLNGQRRFGLSLDEMYDASYIPAKNSTEYALYDAMCADKKLMSLSFAEMNDAMFSIRSKNLAEEYYAFLERKEKNPIIDCLNRDVDLHEVSEVRNALDEAEKKRKGLFCIGKYPFYRQVLAYYRELSDAERSKSVIRLCAKIYKQRGESVRAARERLTEEFRRTYAAMQSFTSGYEPLCRVMTEEGYLCVVDNLLRGNTGYLRNVKEALDNYTSLRDTSKLIEEVDENNLLLLNFAYNNSKTRSAYLSVLDKIMLLRIYHEITKCEEECKNDLSKTIDFANITSRFYALRKQQLSVSGELCSGKISREYDEMYSKSKDAKDYLYQISKKNKFWPIRKTMEIYGKYVLSLFPCWLLSPENVSSLLPLEKNMFDLVIFDEASQVFIENTIPTIFRGRNIVVAGDAKQLRPSATFMKRYLGSDADAEEDYSLQAALEVDSLLDLAVSRYESANLTYHYRSRRAELINFSNYAFYGGTLQIAPNVTRDDSRAIVRYKVKGRWINRVNAEEVKKIVEILLDLSRGKDSDASVGIIAFNSDQQSAIATAIDKEAVKNPELRVYLQKQNQKSKNGEDESLFVKNLENVQGDERDIIIFSIGYAANESGKIYTNFGSLSTEGGENRLNVAVTRAKSKIIVVTSIEPEDLNVEGAKNLGPKLLKKYLTYVRAVSDGDAASEKAVLDSLAPSGKEQQTVTGLASARTQIKEKLEKAGYTVHENVGNGNTVLSLAIYDEGLKQYVLGIEIDTDAAKRCPSVPERDVFLPRFLESRGWTLLRVFCRDYWLSPAKTVKTIVNAINRSKDQIAEKEKANA